MGHTTVAQKKIGAPALSKGKMKAKAERKNISADIKQLFNKLFNSKLIKMLADALGNGYTS